MDSFSGFHPEPQQEIALLHLSQGDFERLCRSKSQMREVRKVLALRRRYGGSASTALSTIQGIVGSFCIQRRAPERRVNVSNNPWKLYR